MKEKTNNNMPQCVTIVTGATSVTVTTVATAATTAVTAVTVITAATGAKVTVETTAAAEATTGPEAPASTPPATPPAANTKQIEGKRDGKSIISSGERARCLNTEKAMTIMSNLQMVGMVDEQLMPMVSDYKAAIMASIIADVLDLQPKWAPFEELWGISDLATKHSISQTCSYYARFVRRVENTMKL